MKDAYALRVGHLRYDNSRLVKPVRTDAGYLIASANITRTGVFTYFDADGNKIREYRSPDEVFNEDSLKSFEDAPLTNDHPPVSLDVKNTKDFQRGNVRNVRKDEDGEHVAANVRITDEEAIGAVEAGKVELSCGYTCDVIFEPGVSPDGIKFDARQTNIRGNHVAIVDRGRAGPTASLRLDSGDAYQVDAAEAVEKEPAEPLDGPKEKQTMESIKVDGVSVEVQPEVAAAFKAKADKVDELQKSLDQEKARADVAEEEIVKLKEASSEVALQQRVNDRLDLERAASKVLGEEAKFDGKSASEIHAEVVLKASPEAKLDGQSAEYIKARFDHVVETHKEETPKGPVEGISHEDSAKAEEFDVAAARAKAYGLKE